MVKNEYLPFGTATGANVLTPAEYEQLAAREAGFVAGVAKSQELNTAWRQASVVASVVAQFIADHSNKDSLDDGNLPELQANLELALKAIIGDETTNFVKTVNDHAPDDKGNVDVTKRDVGLGDVGDYAAVQQGGGTDMESNKVYLGWNGSTLILQVDSTLLGELYYKNNQPPYPVKSVNDKTGAVTLSKSDVGLGSVGNYRAVQAMGGKYDDGVAHSIFLDWATDNRIHITVDDVDEGFIYTSSNTPPYPVTSVNGKTGSVSISDDFSITYPAMLWNSALSGLQMRTGDFALAAPAGSAVNITFPSAFGGGCFIVIPVPNAGSAEEQIGATNFSATGATLQKGSRDASARGGRYIAIGYA